VSFDRKYTPPHQEAFLILEHKEMNMNDKEILVVKYGSASVTQDQMVNFERLEHYADSLAEQSEHYGIIVVSSGAIAVGRGLWYVHTEENHGAGFLSQQSLATVGSGAVFSGWQAALWRRGLLAGQIQVTHKEIEDPDEGGMLQRVLEDNLTAGVVSVINENDALSDIEIAKLKYGGDNDGLAAHIAKAVKASRMCLLTEVDGLLDSRSQLVRTVEQDKLDAYLAMAGGARSNGRGGMRSKFEAALTAAHSGIDSYIGHAAIRLQDVMDGQGTHVAANLTQTIVE
jgi:glutamate 5-kinase